jgi:signal transduction histidine kinase/CheY-like chemotaxis protein/HPt (histidine-containing phosphotransfer) domain-containing protein
VQRGSVQAKVTAGGETASRPRRSLASKYSLFTVLLLTWLAAVVLWEDIRRHTFDWTMGVVLILTVAIMALVIAYITTRLLARPLTLLEQGISSVRQGRLEPIQVSRTGDEIEYLGESFNRMIETLASSQREIREHHELLGERIRQRTAELELAMHGALAASQAKSEFLANMSHELRTPMNGMLGMLDVVLDSTLTSDQREHIETAQRCAYALLGLLNDILDLSKIEAGKMLLEHIPFDVRVILEDVVKSHAVKAAQKRIALRLESDPDGPTAVLGDPLRLRQIISNLVSNALKFTEQGWVNVRHSARTLPSGRIEVSIAVSDTGTGIPKSKQAVIFEKFTQADSSVSRKYGGTGLGLAITRRLVEVHEGSIQVESEPGKGSTFSLTLLFDAASAPVIEAAKPALHHDTTASAGRILLVEDNLVNQKVVLAMLRKHKYSLDVAMDGQEAVAKLEAADRPYDLVLMDVQMPVLDGLEATRIIRRNPRFDQLQIVAMTAHAMNGDRERCLEAGMNGYISKPLQAQVLVDTVERHLSAKAPARGKAPAPAALAAPVTNGLDQVLTARLMQEDKSLMNGMLHLFLNLAPERLERLEIAAGSADASTLRGEAKMIEAAAQQLASSSLRDCARRIEAAAERSDFDAALREVGVLKREIQSLEEVARTPLASGPAT